MSIFREIGGKGINQAIAASRMGAEVSFLTAIGDDAFGLECEKIAEKNRLNAKLVKKKDKKTAVAYILIDKNGENQVTEYQDAFLDENDVLGFEDEIAKSDILLLQQETSLEVNETAIKLTKQHNVKVILNPAPVRKIDDITAESVYMVTPNKQETEYIDVKRFKNHIITLGSEGCLINGKTKINSLKVKAVDTTGAGDTFNGVLAACIGDNMSLEKAAEYVTVASGIGVTRENVINAIPYKDEILGNVK